MNYKQIAIDGPAGSGKSTISKKLAKRLGYTHIDTGAMYRAATLVALKRGIDLERENEYTFINEINIDYDNDIIYIDGKNVEDLIRSKEVTDNVSVVAKHKYVRDKLVEIQREIASKQNVVMDGRDIATVVLPQASLKIFLDASIKVRAERRFAELSNGMTLEELEQDIIRRDKLDSTRDYNPLVKASDAIVIDTSDLTIDEVIEKIIFLNKKGDLN